MPISPLDNTASAMPAQQASIQFLRSSGRASLRCASSNPHSDKVIIADRPISSVFTCDIAAQKKLDARTTAAENPARGPNTLRPAWETSAMPNSPHKPVHGRGCRSPGPGGGGGGAGGRGGGGGGAGGGGPGGRGGGQ